MKTQKISRRAALAQTSLIVGATFASRHVKAVPASTDAAATKKTEPFLFCLNTSTISDQKLGLVKEIEVAAKAGYQGIEPWIRTIDDYVKGGG